MHILYVAEANITPYSGMGRVAWHWRQEAERRGHRWTSLTPAELGPFRHPALFPYQALRAFKRQALRPDLILAHEPAASFFRNKSCPLAAFSHGVEKRQWQLHLASKQGQRPPSIKSRLLTPLWRIHPSERGLRQADLVLVSSQEDQRFVLDHCQRQPRDCVTFRNGVVPHPAPSSISSGDRSGIQPTVGFLASWIPRKGITLLMEAAQILANTPDRPRWLLAATVASDAEIRSQWPAALRDDLQVIPTFSTDQEAEILSQLDVYLLPSFYEGQPLTLLQAMAAGLPCVASDCCGQRDLIRDGVNGRLFPPGDASALARCLQDLLASPSRRQRLGQAARQSVSDRTWPQVSAEVIDRLELLVQAPPPSRP